MRFCSAAENSMSHGFVCLSLGKTMQFKEVSSGRRLELSGVFNDFDLFSDDFSNRYCI